MVAAGAKPVVRVVAGALLVGGTIPLAASRGGISDDAALGADGGGASGGRSLAQGPIAVGASAGGRRVLIAERPPGKHMAGRWEFPGGKVAAGESEATALARELREELGVTVRECRPFMRLSHEYDDRIVELSFWTVEAFDGEPMGLEGQGLKWVPVADLGNQGILEADAPFVEALQRAELERSA